MNKLLDKLYKSDKDTLIKDILSNQKKEGLAIINFLYFAAIENYKLLNNKKQNNLAKEYYKALNEGDFLLPDGIALQLLYKAATKDKKGLANLNGTDFVPYFLDKISSDQKINLVLYGAVKEVNKKLTKKWSKYNVVYSQDGFTELDWDTMENNLKSADGKLNVMLVARSTASNPIQELRVNDPDNIKKLKKNKFIVITVAGLFDFMVGQQKRAPQIIRIIKLEWLRRLIANPRKDQLKKVLASLSIFRYIFSYLVLKKS